MDTILLYQVDAFTSRPFGGNPAAVVLLPTEMEQDWMQSVAAEMNLSETAFLRPKDDGFELRWFTPTIEVDLCGHATLAAAHVLWESGVLEQDQTARFYTRSGCLLARQTAEGMVLDFPRVFVHPVKPPSGLLSSLGLGEEAVYQAGDDTLVCLANERAVRALAPDFSALAKISMRGVMVTAESDQLGVDFVSRFFAPAAGILEDPVTGSAHCALADFWHRRNGKIHFLARQISQRGGEIHVELKKDRVALIGRAVTVFSGQWHR